MAPRGEVAAATKERLLGVAGQVLGRDGGAGLTLEAVAREAGITKGGILYHFGTKEALVAAMIDRLGADFERDLDGRISDRAGDASSGAFARAYVGATFEPGEPQSDDHLGVAGALLAAVAGAPELLDPLRARYAAWQRRVEADGIDPAAATVVRLAADGLVMAEMLGLAPPDPALRARVLETLRSMTRGDQS